MNQIIQNLHDARSILKDAPGKQIDLQYFARKQECGTIYCAAGWLANTRWFSHIMELYWPADRWDGKVAFLCRPGQTPNVDRPIDLDWLDEHFGPAAFDRLFAPYGEGEFDRFHPQMDIHNLTECTITDKELVLWRIEEQLKDLV